MLIRDLRKILSSNGIAETTNRNEGTIRNILAGLQGDSTRDVIDYEIAGQVLFAIKERHDRYVKNEFPLHDAENERQIFLENNVS